MITVMAASHDHCSKSIWMHLDNLSWEKPNIWSCALCHSTDFGNIAGHRVCVSSSLVHRNSTVLSKVLCCLISPREETRPSAVPDKIDYCCSQRSETKKVKQSIAYSRNIWLYIQPAKPLIIKLGESIWPVGALPIPNSSFNGWGVFKYLKSVFQTLPFAPYTLSLEELFFCSSTDTEFKNSSVILEGRAIHSLMLIPWRRCCLWSSRN